MNFTLPQNLFTKKRLIIAGVVLVVALLSIGLGILIRNMKRPPIGNVDTNSVISYEDAVKSGAIEASDKEVFVANLIYDESKNPQVLLGGLKRYTNGAPNSPSGVPSDYKIEIIRGEDVLYSDYFAKQPETIAESFSDNNDKITGKMVAKSSDIPLVMPWFGENTTLRVVDITGNVILSQSLSSVEVVQNSPSFDTIQGQDVK